MILLGQETLNREVVAQNADATLRRFTAFGQRLDVLVPFADACEDVKLNRRFQSGAALVRGQCVKDCCWIWW